MAWEAEADLWPQLGRTGFSQPITQPTTFCHNPLGKPRFADFIYLSPEFGQFFPLTI
jgi:hypothetical protein